MIQRIQSLFLLLAIVCLGGMILSPIATFANSVTWGTSGLSGLAEGQSPEGLLPFPLQGIVIGLMALTAFILFSFKNRKRQLALGKLNFLLLLGLVVVMFLSISRIAEGLEQSVENVGYGLSSYLPIVALAFQLLANRAVKRDEALVRSVDRLR